MGQCVVSLCPLMGRGLPLPLQARTPQREAVAGFPPRRAGGNKSLAVAAGTGERREALSRQESQSHSVIWVS